MPCEGVDRTEGDEVGVQTKGTSAVCGAERVGGGEESPLGCRGGNTETEEVAGVPARGVRKEPGEKEDPPLAVTVSIDGKEEEASEDEWEGEG